MAHRAAQQTRRRRTRQPRRAITNRRQRKRVVLVIALIIVIPTTRLHIQHPPPRRAPPHDLTDRDPEDGGHARAAGLCVRTVHARFYTYIYIYTYIYTHNHSRKRKRQRQNTNPTDRMGLPRRGRQPDVPARRARAPGPRARESGRAPSVPVSGGRCGGDGVPGRYK